MSIIECNATSIGGLKRIRAVHSENILLEYYPYAKELAMPYGLYVFDWKYPMLNATYEIAKDNAYIKVTLQHSIAIDIFTKWINQQLINKSVCLELLDYNNVTQVLQNYVCRGFTSANDSDRTGKRRYELQFVPNKPSSLTFKQKPILQTVTSYIKYYTQTVPTANLIIQLFEYCDYQNFIYSIADNNGNIIRQSNTPEFINLPVGIYTVSVQSIKYSSITESLSITILPTPVIKISSSYPEYQYMPKQRLIANKLYDTSLIDTIEAELLTNSYSVQVKTTKPNLIIKWGYNSDIRQAKPKTSNVFLPNTYYFFVIDTNGNYDYRKILLPSIVLEDIITT